LIGRLGSGSPPTAVGSSAEKTNSNYNRAEEECNTFESFKGNKYRPKWARVNSEILSGIGQNSNM
jgi:hypothetical protein